MRNLEFWLIILVFLLSIPIIIYLKSKKNDSVIITDENFNILFLVITYFYIFYTLIWKIKFFLKRLFKIKEKNSKNIRVVKIGYIKGGIDKNGRF